MPMSLQVIYPISPGTHFDMGYYTDTHLPKVSAHIGDQIASLVASKGLSGGPDTPPAYYAVATMTFADQDALDAALCKLDPLVEDIPNFTNAIPKMLVGEVIG